MSCWMPACAGMTPGRRGRIAHCSSRGSSPFSVPPDGGPFGISWPATCLAWKPPEKGVGFPWIFSSESRLIKGLRGIFGEKNFEGASAPWAFVAPGREVRRRGYGEAQNCPSRKPNYGSDFLQSIVSLTVSRSRLDCKQLGLANLNHQDRCRTKADKQLGLAEVRFAQIAVIHRPRAERCNRF